MRGGTVLVGWLRRGRRRVVLGCVISVLVGVLPGQQQCPGGEQFRCPVIVQPVQQRRIQLLRQLRFKRWIVVIVLRDGFVIGGVVQRVVVFVLVVFFGIVFFGIV